MKTTDDPVPLTACQKAILDYIGKHSTMRSPTFRDIAKAFGYRSPNAVTVHVEALERKGYLRRAKGRHRGIEVLP